MEHHAISTREAFLSPLGRYSLQSQDQRLGNLNLAAQEISELHLLNETLLGVGPYNFSF